MSNPEHSIQNLGAADLRFAWELNESEVPHVGTETWHAFNRLCAISILARVAWVGAARAGFLLGMTAETDYDSPNFLFFRRHGDPAGFLYVDRIAVAAAQRTLGVGARLYQDAEAWSRAHGVDRICCEVNLRPANPGSLAFHTRLGFQQVGEQLAHGKTVALLVKQL